MKDNEIISLFEVRDEHAIEALSDKYHPYCYKIAWNLLTNKEDSEECLNDTWFSVWSLIPPKKPSVLSHFCGRITRNLSIDRLRKKYADRRPDLHMADVLGEMDQLSVTYTIEDQLAEKELLEIINGFLGKMDAEARDIFVRRYWFFDSVAAIAERHAMSVGSVKMNLYRSRKKLFWMRAFYCSGCMQKLIITKRMSRKNLRIFHLLRIRELHLTRIKLQ